MRLNKKYKCLVMIGALALLLAGCEKKDKVDYIDNDNTGTEQIVSTDAKIEEKWEETIDHENEIFVAADVIIPDTTIFKVINAKEKYFTPEDRKTILNTFSEQVYMYGDQYLPKAEVAELIAFDEAQIEKYSSYKGDEMWLQLYKDSLAIHQEMYETAPDDYVVAEDYSGYRYMSIRDEKKYIFGFYGVYGEDEIYHDNIRVSDKGSYIIIEPYNVEDFCQNSEDKEYSEISIDYRTGNKNVENRCLISEAEANGVVDEFVRNFDFGNFKVIKSYPLRFTGVVDPGTYDVDSWYDGYCFIYNRSIEGVCVDGNFYDESNYALSQISDTGAGAYAPGYGFEEIIVCVNDNGIVYMEYAAPLELTDTVTDDAAIINYDSAKNILAETLENSDYYITYSCMELAYFPMKGENDDDIVIVPAWRLTDNNPRSDTNDSIYHYRVINALDGVEINVGERIYHSLN